MPQSRWQLVSAPSPPIAFVEQVQQYCGDGGGHFAAPLLWQRGIQSAAQLQTFLDADHYQPTSPFDFGQEMKWAVKRLDQARQNGDRVAIWGDFDADGVTSTAVLWEGLGQFFPQGRQLSYTIPNRLRESHGLNRAGLERLAAEGTKVIVTCDTGSTNLAEIDYANQLGMDVIVTDHHTLPDDRPNVIAIINPRYFAESHPLYHLSGVAVAFKLVEALYLTLPNLPQQPLEQLLDLVAIGLIADLVQLTGDCRYLAQKGIEQLKKQKNPATATRPGVQKLLDCCNRNGDRPTDIGFGIGPRINAISRIKGDASFGVELLTSRDADICDRLVTETETLNARRKGLQKTVIADIQKRLGEVDVSTTGVIILADPQWPPGVLGLAASQIAQEYGRPVVLLNTQDGDMARGSARSVANIDLYELLKSQQHLVVGFGGHPFAAGLSLPVDKLPLFKEAINQQFWQHYSTQISLDPVLPVDLVVTVADLGQGLFRELSLLEPYGMGNPVPKLLIETVRFSQTSFFNIKDKSGNKVSYLQSKFTIADSTNPSGFPGVWWGHHPDELPADQDCDVVVELDFNTYSRRYEVRLIDFQVSRPSQAPLRPGLPEIIDRRSLPPSQRSPLTTGYPVRTCPVSWTELAHAYHQAIAAQEPLVLDYDFTPAPISRTVEKIQTLWQQCQQQPQPFTPTLLQKHCGFSDLLARQIVTLVNESPLTPTTDPHSLQATLNSLQALIAEEAFQKRYFSQIPLTPAFLETVSSS
ncbi:MAG: single-stranded-DNA-specific exonuclease RecJ [Synechocystis sp.]|nr:single-stranded-DNA-specific exonuclease RecJ [Synechocystis sp.]